MHIDLYYCIRGIAILLIMLNEFLDFDGAQQHVLHHIFMVSLHGVIVLRSYTMPCVYFAYNC